MSLRARLSGCPTATDIYRLRVGDDRAARAELAAARAGGDETRIAAAQAAVEACYEEVVITALPPQEMEDLREEHPPTEEQREHNALFNPTTFYPALLSKCIDSDVTADDWREYTTKGPLSPGEANDLIGAVWELNYRTPDPNVVPKG